MKFKINGREWEIIEAPQEKLKEIQKDKSEQGEYFGLTCYDTQKIYLWNTLTKEAKRQTLMHELMHCYIGVYCSFQDMTWTEDIICNLCANAHDTIETITKAYFLRNN